MHQFNISYSVTLVCYLVCDTTCEIRVLELVSLVLAHVVLREARPLEYSWRFSFRRKKLYSNKGPSQAWVAAWQVAGGRVTVLMGDWTTIG